MRGVLASGKRERKAVRGSRGEGRSFFPPAYRKNLWGESSGENREEWLGDRRADEVQELDKNRRCSLGIM